MKKIITLIFVLLFTTSNIQAVNINNYNRSLTVVNYYISRSVELGDTSWQGYSVVSYKPIVDNQLEEYGYVFNLESSTSEGYAIVTCANNACSVVEASFDSPSPYKAYENSHYLVYCTPLEYLVVEKSKGTLKSPSVKNVETNASFSLDKSNRVRFVGQAITTKAVPGETTRYISQYSSKFEAINQNYSYNCVATSMAMCLRYLHNIGTISITIGSNTNPSATTIRNQITSYYSSASGSDSVVRPAINTFGTNHCSPRIFTQGDGFWGNSQQTDISFSTIIAEINSNCPLVMMFNPGRVDSGITVNHATACVGYKTLNNDSTGGSTINYTIVRMPIQSSSNTSVATKQVAWNYTNVHGYYLVYIV